MFIDLILKNLNSYSPPPAIDLYPRWLEDFIGMTSIPPARGSIIYCDLFGQVEHSGVFIGDNQIVHLNGRGLIEVVSLKSFTSKSLNSNFIHIFCKDGKPVGSELIARRAEEMVGGRRSYNFILDNCHQFTSGCVTGNFENSDNFLLFLSDTVSRHLNCNERRIWQIERLKLRLW